MRAVERFDRNACAIEHDQASRLCRCRHAVRSGQAADDHPARPQESEHRREPRATGTRSRQSRRINLREDAERSIRSEVHDRGARSLQILAVIEIADKNMARGKIPDGLCNANDSVWIHIAVRWHCGAYERYFLVVVWKRFVLLCEGGGAKE
jgi:hypothetical protein